MPKKDQNEDVMNYSNISILDNNSSPRSPMQIQLKHLMSYHATAEKAFVQNKMVYVEYLKNNKLLSKHLRVLEKNTSYAEVLINRMKEPILVEKIDESLVVSQVNVIKEDKTLIYSLFLKEKIDKCGLINDTLYVISSSNSSLIKINLGLKTN